MALSILAGASLLGLGAAGLTYVGLSLTLDLLRGLARRRRPRRPTLWQNLTPPDPRL